MTAEPATHSDLPNVLELLRADRAARQTGDVSKLDFTEPPTELVRVSRVFGYIPSAILENVIIAGGAVNAILDSRLTVAEIGTKTDIDFFFYGIDSDQAKQRLQVFNQFLKKRFKRFKVIRTAASYTFVVQSKVRSRRGHDDDDNEPDGIKFQFVTALYPTAEHVLLSFDVSCCAVGMTHRAGELVLISTPLCRYSRQTRLIPFDPWRGSYNTFSFCIERWLQNNNTCPVCRARIPSSTLDDVIRESESESEND
jgi:hypothetical protein